MEKARILLVDDEEDFAKNMKKLLENRGHAVTTLNSGDGAVAAIAGGGQYDVMVLDLKMPGMDGMATLREMKKQNLEIQTLVLTGHGDIGTALEAMKLGAYDYLTKPCEIDELEEKLEELWKKSNGKKPSMLGKLLNKK
ncbi:MAG: response regulator [Desulfobacteraceae bacterium]|nr:response regulator [Desulfobacteraceae bacterium]